LFQKRKFYDNFRLLYEYFWISPKSFCISPFDRGAFRNVRLAGPHNRTSRKGTPMATITYDHEQILAPVVLSDAYTTNIQGSPSIAALTDGTLVTTFNHFGTTQLAMTAYKAGTNPSNSTPLFESGPVNSTTAGDQFDSQTIGLTGGGFVTIFNDMSSGENQIRYRVFDAKGVALGPDAVVFDGFPTTKMGGVAALSDGGFVITFEPNDLNGNSGDVDFARFDANGVLKGGWAVDDLPQNTTTSPSVAALAKGGYAIVWSEHDGAKWNTYVSKYGDNNSSLTGKIKVDSIGGSTGNEPQIIGLKDGGFAVAYLDYSSGNFDQKMRIYNEDGTARTAAFKINQVTAGTQNNPSLALLDNGFIAVTWDTSAPGSANSNVAARIFDRNGVAITGEFNIAAGGSIESGGDAVGIAGGTLAHVYSTSDTTVDGNGSAVVYTEMQITRTTVGNGTDETLKGDELIDNIFGGGGKDTITAGGGDDIVEGGAGGDKLDGGTGLNTLSYEGSLVGVEIDLLGGTAKYGDAAGDTIVYSSFFKVVGSATGDDTLYGTAGNNRLYGGGGKDTLVGNGGHDVLSGEDGNDFLVASKSTGSTFDGGGGVDWISYESETVGITLNLDGSANAGGASNDKVYGIENVLGSSHDDTITGTDGVDNMLDGSEGLDKIFGLGGNDTLKGGIGSDTLDGGKGTDTLEGGQDDDTLIVDMAGDIVVEVAGGGSADRVMARVSYTLATDVDVEKLTTTSSAGVSAIDLSGNKLSQEIAGNAGENTLKDGGGAADILRGLAGNDTYLVYSIGTTIVEGAAQGALDKVLSNIDYVLEAGVHVEQLATTSGAGTSGIDLTGNEIAQTLIGNAGSNILDGKEGSDTLSGLSGMDFFVFSTALGATNVDTITDFSVVADTIQLENAIFTALTTTGTLSPDAFRANTTGLAAAASDRIIYETDTGKLFYDADGSGAGNGIHFATVTDGLAFTNADFVVV
jgi:Ca2+-binding RTX toxin-like protein